MMPLNYAILKLFTDGRTACPEEVIEALKANYPFGSAYSSRALNLLVS